MVQYIDKAAIMAEIERMLEAITNAFGQDVRDRDLGALYSAQLLVLRNLAKYINTLEVKEVDLELDSFDATVCKNCSTYLKEMDKDAIIKALEPYKDGDKVKVMIKSQKGK